MSDTFWYMDYRQLKCPSNILNVCLVCLINLFDRALGFHCCLLGLIVGDGMFDGCDCQVGQVVFRWSLIHSIISSINTDHIFPHRTEQTDGALVQTVCTMWLFMLVQHLHTYTRIHFGMQKQKWYFAWVCPKMVLCL